MNTIDKILENQRVWQALSTDDESAISDIVIESFSKCADSIAALGENLKSIGYIWVSSEPIPVDMLEGNIRTIETNTGLSIPKVLIEFWKLVGGISFVDLKNYDHIDFWDKNKIISPKGFADGLKIDTCSHDWTTFICQDYAEWKDYIRQDETDNFLFTLSPDGYHKDNISGGLPYGVFAESSWKPIWQNFEWSGSIQPITALANSPDFVSYLRTTILECAGFPALLGVPAFDILKEKLLQGVPIF